MVETLPFGSVPASASARRANSRSMAASASSPEFCSMEVSAGSKSESAA